MTDTQQILTKLNDLEKKVDTFIAVQAEVIKAASEQRLRHEQTLYDPSRGMCVRLQDAESKVGLIWVGVVGFILAGIKVIWDMISSRTIH